MRQLLQCLLVQQHNSRIKVALGLLMNATPPAPAAAAAPDDAQQHSHDSPGVASGSAAASDAAVALVRLHLLPLLTPRDLAAEELMLPLLQLVAEAAASSSWAAAAGAAELLAHCTPTGRCLESLHALLEVRGAICVRLIACACWWCVSLHV